MTHARIALLGSMCLFAAGCAGESSPEHVSAAERGEHAFTDARESTSAFSCSMCHSTSDDSNGRILPGGDLRGVTERATFWGGQEDDLLRSVNDCRTYFQGSRDELEAASPASEDLYAFLLTLEGSDATVPFSVVQSVKQLPAGDALRGSTVFDGACRGCHGALHSGAGRLHAGIPTLPDEVLAEHDYLSEDDRRLVFIEKVRHGGFLHYGGYMPPFSLEVMSDADLSALLTFMGVVSP